MKSSLVGGTRILPPVMDTGEIEKGYTQESGGGSSAPAVVPFRTPYVPKTDTRMPLPRSYVLCLYGHAMGDDLPDHGDRPKEVESSWSSTSGCSSGN
jgi:hypothetical protein